MDTLLIAIAAIFVGIGVVPWLSGRRELLAALDGFVVAAIAGVVLVHLLPYALLEAGWLAALAALVGLALPGLLEGRSAARDGLGSANTVMALAGVGLALHAFLDGAALASAEHASVWHDGASPEHGETLALAVIVHRLPMGLVLGMVALKRRRAGWMMGVVVAAATWAGFTLGANALPFAGVRSLALLQALVAGSLLHVVFAHPPGELGASDPRTRSASGLGALGGVALTIELALDHPVAQHCAQELGANQALLRLALQAAPWLLAALLGTGLLSALVRLDHERWLRGGGALSQASRGLVAGLPLPICSCGILPVYEDLLSRKVPRPAALAFLMGTPLLGLDALLISWPLFGAELTTARLLSAAIAAVLIAMVVGLRMQASRVDHDDHDHDHDQQQPEPSLAARLRAGLRFGLGDLVDHLLPWLVFGFALAALAEPVLHELNISGWSVWIQISVAAAVGLPLYVSASGATPLLAVLLHKGLAPGAAIAFLLTAPAMNSETLTTLRARHGVRAALGLVTMLALVAGGLGLATEALMGALGPGPAAIDMHTHGGANEVLDIADAMHMASLTALGALAVVSLLRSGARGWLGQLRVRYGEHVHHAQDGHACAHDHGHAHAHAHEESR